MPLSPSQAAHGSLCLAHDPISGILSLPELLGCIVKGVKKEAQIWFVSLALIDHRLA